MLNFLKCAGGPSVGDLTTSNLRCALCTVSNTDHTEGDKVDRSYTLWVNASMVRSIAESTELPWQSYLFLFLRSGTRYQKLRIIGCRLDKNRML